MVAQKNQVFDLKLQQVLIKERTVVVGTTGMVGGDLGLPL